MFNGRRVVICVPSGRYRYLRILLPYLLADRFASVIDEIKLWVNTDVPSDLEYFARMAQTFPKIKQVRAAGNISKQLYDGRRDHYQYNDSIYRFYQGCIEADTLYCKIDDDICFVHDDFFTHMLRAVTSRHRQNYACVGNVYNIPYTSKLQQDRGTLDAAMGHSTGDPRCPIACTNGEFAAHIHKQFLALATCGQLESLYFDSHNLKGRQRIGTMAWTGENFQQFGGRVGPRDEVELTTRIPEALLKPLWIVGDALTCHFAFSHQRAVLEDQTDLLGQYQALSARLNGDVAA
jgi:hypothetical protein